MILKVCKKCEKEKDLSEFYKRNSNNTYFNNCKECEKEIHHAKNPDNKRNYVSCKICNKEFIYNAGLFTGHLRKEHNISSRKEYVIITEYNGIQPKCQCGYCNDDAIFISRKNKFHKINFEHRSFVWLEDHYLKKYGNPKCQNQKCDKIVGFNRGKPEKYCSFKCLPNNWNQEKIKKTVKEKYGVDNIMHVPEIYEKNRESLDNMNPNEKEKIYKKAIKTKKERYENGSFDPDKFKKTMIEKYGVEHPSQMEKFKKDSSERMIENNPMTNGSYHIKSQKFKHYNLFYQSSYEYKFLEKCEKLGIINEIKRGETYHYLENSKFGFYFYPDFQYKNIVIEIKSNWILEIQGGQDKINEMKRIVESYGKKYFIFLDKNFNNDYNEFENLISNK